MIIALLQGGLGNQMFQYAIGKALSIKNDDTFFLDKTFLDTHTQETEILTPRKFELNIFSIQYQFASQKIIKKFLNPNIFQRILNRLNISKRVVFHENVALFSNKVFTIRGNIYLSGYWQSEKYFKDIEQQIRGDFEFASIDNQTIERANDIKTFKNAVSIHIRRGDYVNKKIISAGHGVCSVEYYKTGISLLEEKYAPEHYFFFSDDTEWVKQNLFFNPSKMTVIDKNKGDDSWKDMYLMSQCYHNIIANSSFSWWGAWLNKNPDKLVIAPKKWFAEPKKNEETSTLVPESWIRI